MLYYNVGSARKRPDPSGPPIHFPPCAGSVRQLRARQTNAWIEITDKNDAGLLITAATMGTWWSIVGMSIAAMGFYGSKGPFFALPSMFMSGTAVAVSLAWINSLGNLGGYFGPLIVGHAHDTTGNFAPGIYVLAGFAAMSAVVTAVALRIPCAIAARATMPAE